MKRLADYILRMLYITIGFIIFIIACIIKGRKVRNQNKVKALPNTNTHSVVHTVSLIRNANL